MNFKTINRCVLSAAIAGTLAFSPNVLAGEHAESVDEKVGENWQKIQEGSKRHWDNTQAAFENGWVLGKLETALAMNEYLNPFKIDTEVKGNHATLNGTVDSETKRELAENLALGISGIAEVTNNLTVEQRAVSRDNSEERDFEQYVEDVGLSASIKSELLASPNVSGVNIDVDTYQSEVTLTGKVKSKEEKELVEKIVAKRDDVKDINNRLDIQS